MTPDTRDCHDDSPLLMRRGRPDDIDRALDFERHLSPGTRYFRFGKMQDLGFDRDRLAGLFNPDDDHNIHYIVTIAVDSREIMIASGRLVIPSAGSSGEMLIVVGDDWQGRGGPTPGDSVVPGGDRQERAHRLLSGPADQPAHADVHAKLRVQTGNQPLSRVAVAVRKAGLTGRSAFGVRRFTAPRSGRGSLQQCDLGRQRYLDHRKPRLRP